MVTHQDDVPMNGRLSVCQHFRRSIMLSNKQSQTTQEYVVLLVILLRYGDGAGNTVEENSSVFYLM